MNTRTTSAILRLTIATSLLLTACVSNQASNCASDASTVGPCPAPGADSGSGPSPGMPDSSRDADAPMPDSGNDADAGQQAGARDSGHSAAPLSVSGGTLLKDGVSYRAVGVNYYDAFYRLAANSADTSYRAGFATLQANHIPFIRFPLMPFWPDQAAPFINDPASLLKLLDGFVADAASYNVGLVPDVFWNLATLPDVMGEPVSAWGTPSSKTVAFAKSFSAALAARYRDSPTIWAWEFINEMDAWADYPGAYMSFPVDPSQGTPASRSTADDFSSAQMLFAYQSFADAIRSGDPARLVVSGYGGARHDAFNGPGSGVVDTEAQFDSVTARANAPGDICSVHVYPESVNQSYDWRFSDVSVDAPQFVTAAASAVPGKPMMYGEFGSLDDGTEGTAAVSLANFTAILSAFAASPAPLALAWVFDFSFQDINNGNFNITATNAHADRLALLKSTNENFGH